MSQSKAKKPSKPEKPTSEVTRPKRASLKNRSVISAPTRPGYRRRMVNDTPGRIDRMKELGYTIVEDNIEIGEQRADTPSSDMGGSVTRPVGGGVTGYLMETPEDLYQEGREELEEMCLNSEEDAMPDESEAGEIEGKVTMTSDNSKIQRN